MKPTGITKLTVETRLWETVPGDILRIRAEKVDKDE
jgi:hypothetical protein